MTFSVAVAEVDTNGSCTKWAAFKDDPLYLEVQSPCACKVQVDGKLQGWMPGGEEARCFKLVSGRGWRPVNVVAAETNAEIAAAFVPSADGRKMADAICSDIAARCIEGDCWLYRIPAGKRLVFKLNGRFRGFPTADVFCDLGRGAVHITGGGSRENPNGTTVDNCHIHHIGRLSHCDNAIFMEGCGFRVRHNLFHDLPHWAVFHTGNCHELTDNRVHHYMLETEDGAAFYTCNPNGNRNTVIARNWISDGIGFGKCAGFGPLAFYVNSHGLYFDAGPGGGKVYDNVIERVSCMAIKMDSNDRQLVSNNVFHCIGRPELHHWS